MSQVEAIKKKLLELKPELVRRYHVSSIGLFGSVVRDDFSDTHSDVDILIDFSKPIGIEFIDLAEFLEARLSRKVDLVSKKGIKAKYFNEIEPELIYV